MYNYTNCESYNYGTQALNHNPQFSATIPGNNPNLVNAREGLIRGNLFSDLYQPYVAGEPFPLMPQNEQEELLNKVREVNFAKIDLGLYLDTHPEDADILRTYNQYRLQSNQLTSDYENRYGPLTLRSDALNNYPWAWINSPWPWEVR